MPTVPLEGNWTFKKLHDAEDKIFFYAREMVDFLDFIHIAEKRVGDALSHKCSLDQRSHPSIPMHCEVHSSGRHRQGTTQAPILSAALITAQLCCQSRARTINGTCVASS